MKRPRLKAGYVRFGYEMTRAIPETLIFSYKIENMQNPCIPALSNAHGLLWSIKNNYGSLLKASVVRKISMITACFHKSLMAQNFSRKTSSEANIKSRARFYITDGKLFCFFAVSDEWSNVTSVCNALSLCAMGWGRLTRDKLDFMFLLAKLLCNFIRSLFVITAGIRERIIQKLKFIDVYHSNQSQNSKLQL